MAANGIQMEEMATFIVGEALISYEGLMKPFKMRMHEWCGHLKGKEKKAVVESRNDTDLKALMADRAVYREICRRSYIIAGKKYYAEYTRLEKESGKYTDIFNAVNAAEILIRGLEETRRGLLKQRDSSNEEELKRLTYQINSFKDESAQRLKTSPYYRGVEEFITEHIKLLGTISSRKARWARLGIEDVSAMADLEKMTAGNAIRIYLAARGQIKDKVTHEMMSVLARKYGFDLERKEDNGKN